MMIVSLTNLKNLSCILLTMIIMAACKKDSPDPESSLNLIAGDWKKTAQWNKDANDWTAIPETEQEIVRFRNDGLQVNENDEAFCCITYEYTINRVAVKLNIEGDIPYISGCEAMLCYACQKLDMKVEDNTLIIADCNGGQLKLQRL